MATVGGVVKSYQILVDPLKLSQFSVTLPEIKQAVEMANQEAGGSSIEIAES